MITKADFWLAGPLFSVPSSSWQQSWFIDRRLSKHGVDLLSRC
jgi:hypothetical protein